MNLKVMKNLFDKYKKSKNIILKVSYSDFYLYDISYQIEIINNTNQDIYDIFLYFDKEIKSILDINIQDDIKILKQNETTKLVDYGWETFDDDIIYDSEDPIWDLFVDFLYSIRICYNLEKNNSIFNRKKYKPIIKIELDS